ncbi:hypothetical protein RIF29_08131 [Crotalaria pallida]|uniref:Glycosyltransferase n=1 Tax=Crotalaria pallida TaxID=3830 RepID=A0AAN9PB73_CROPI
MACPDVKERPLKIYFIPFLAAGHIIPLSDIARLFASHGHNVTIITTPSNAKILHRSISTNFHVHTIQFPFQEVGLPHGIENLSDATDLANLGKVFEATKLLQGHMEHFVEQHPPDCVVADFLYPWVHDLANQLGIPRLAFNGFPLFAVCAMEALKQHPISAAASSHSYIIPGFPHHITMNAAPPKQIMEALQPLLDLELKSFGLIVNNFEELDGQEYIKHYEKTSGHKAWHLGPASFVRETTLDKAERGINSVVSVHECLSWLDSKRDNSVLYICFGSLCQFPDNQLHEIACGIEASGHGFIWVVPEKKGKEDESDEAKEKWLPKGFEERNKMKGMIIRGWAPQVLILDHPAVGAFLTHCGWNSTVEAVSAGVPMITWPVHGEQFFNEKLITEVRRIGVELGAGEWSPMGFGERKKLICREQIEKAVRRLMDGGDEAQEIKQRAQEFGKKAREAVQQGGSSHNNLTALIDELKRLRDSN